MFLRWNPQSLGISVWELSRKVVFLVDWVSSMTCPGDEIYEIHA